MAGGVLAAQPMIATLLTLTLVGSISDDLTPSDIRELSRPQLVEALNLVDELRPTYFVPILLMGLGGAAAGLAGAPAVHLLSMTVTFGTALVGGLLAAFALGAGAVVVAGFVLMLYRSAVQEEYFEVETRLRVRLNERPLQTLLTF